MSDNRKRYRAIKNQLWQMFAHCSARQKQYLLVLAQLISGIIGSHQTQLSEIAACVSGAGNNKAESRTTQYRRWLKLEQLEPSHYFAPFARALLQALSRSGPLVLIIDGSGVGQGCMALVISVRFGGRALPIGWLVVKSKKGHLAQSLHIRLLKQVKPLVPPTAQVVFLGDGEFDGCRLLRRLDYYGWKYVCRTAKNSRLYSEGEETNFAELGVERGGLVYLSEASFSREGLGPLLALGVWETAQEEPLYLVSNLELAQEAVWYYKLRFHIETFFSDLKTRGFNIQRSHLKEPKRLARLLLAACLAYLWLVYLGTVVLKSNLVGVIGRPDRTDLSLFTLGKRFLIYVLDEEQDLPVAFVPLGSPALLKSVR